MANVLDLTLKKILKIARGLSIFKTIFYLIGGILILVLNGKIENYIYLIVGTQDRKKWEQWIYRITKDQILIFYKE